MHNSAIYLYLLLTNLIAGIIFIWDKQAARNGIRRVPEKILHLLELLGGVILILPLMYIIRHKNRKFSYYAITYLLLAVWILTGYFLLTQKHIE